MRIVWENIVDDATLSTVSEDPNYPVEAIQDTRVSRVYKSLADNAQAIVFANASSSASYLFILGHNFTNAATITIQGNNTDAWGAPSFSESVTWREGTIYHAFNEATYNYWRLYVDDAANPDGKLEIGRVFMGTYLQMPGMDPKQQISRKTDAKPSFSGSRQAYGSKMKVYRAPNINMPNVTHAQRLLIQEMHDEVQNVQPIVLMIWANQLDYEPPIYCLVSNKELKWKKTNQPNFPWSLQIGFEEVF